MKVSTSNTVMRKIFEMAREMAPGQFHECPYDIFESYNMTAPMHEFLNFLPSGEYKYVIVLKTEAESQHTLRFSLEFRINSVRDRLG
jgi:hypothetical protein